MPPPCNIWKTAVLPTDILLSLIHIDVYKRQNVERPGFTPSEKLVGATFMRQFSGCSERILVTTFASNVHRIQQVLDAAAATGRKVAVTGRSMENMMRVSTELGYMKVPKNTLVDINKIKGLPKNKQVIVTTGSQGEEMSALYRLSLIHI